uniref:Propionate--CoA ligase n=1 Tax=Xenopus tropicalis TaxID=8364 RepID=A0A6I8SCC7_XENTR|eukprot:XP_017949726.1 PREDICTED: acetyl-coenzyme A synthetase 2-like, mitochondrial isoform X2 [Xenopus tropicalis]
MAAKLTSRALLHHILSKHHAPSSICPWRRLEARYCFSVPKQKIQQSQLQVASLPWDVQSYMPEAAALSSLHSYQELLQFSVQDPETFWGVLARERLTWVKPYQTVKDCDFTQGRVRWFLGGQLNVSVNCLDKHVHQCPERTALIWERDEPGTHVNITYRELLNTTCRIANTLKKYGIQRGDRVAIYMPVSPLAVAAMLACTRIGAVHTVVFAGFSAESLAGRINDACCKAVITFNQGLRGGRTTELKKTVDEAVKNCPSIKNVFVAQRTENEVPMGKIDIPLEEEMAKADATCPPEAMNSEDMLFLLYTSGSTGKPKGIVHTQAGYLLYAALTHKYVFDYKQGDVFGCVADIGWITGHSYVVYGPLCNGATTVLFESTPTYPNPGRYWETIERLRINQFYGAPTAIRLLLKYGDEWVKKYDRSSLKTLGSVGEPINHEAWEWFHDVVGEKRCTLVDTWWQTGHYFTGDGAYRSNDGYYQITGRMDDVINISGHRLGTAEIEDAMDEHPDVPETAVIGYPHEIKGEAAFAFVVLKEDLKIAEEAIKKELQIIVATKIAKYAVPDHILMVKRLPKTRSGKIMRRVLRKIATGETEELGDITTLEDPGVIQEILEAYTKYKEAKVAQ